MYNGVYEDLTDVIRHYDNMIAQGFTVPEVNTNIANELDVGGGTGLGLSADEIDDLEAFMLTLTDGYF